MLTSVKNDDLLPLNSVSSLFSKSEKLKDKTKLGNDLKRN